MKAVFLDRDGTINVDTGYLHKPEDWQFIPGAKEALALFKKSGFLVIIVTNQSGIGRGYYTVEDMHRLHSHMNSLLEQYNAQPDALYFCPHAPEDTCQCRKPEPGLVNTACRDYDIDLSCSFIIGDKNSDIQTGINTGLSPVLVLTGEGRKTLAKHPEIEKTASVFETLYDAAKSICGEQQ